MNPQQRLDLKDLRAAAQERNQQQCQFLLKRLLTGLDFYVALAVPLERIIAWLDTFEHYYPDETWVRTLLLMIANYGTAPDTSVPEMALQQDFASPGIGNYLKAVYDLTQSMQTSHTPEARIGFLASAVVNVIVAELAEAWYGQREKAWQRVHAAEFDPATGGYREDAANLIAYTFWTHEETAARDSAAWLAIADSVEAKLRRLEAQS